jgi:integrase
MGGTVGGTAEAKVRAYRRGSIWYFDVWSKGRRTRKPGGRTREAALEAARRFLVDGEGEALPAILNDWLAHCRTAGQRPRSIRTAENCSARLCRHFGPVLLGSINLEALDGFKAARVSEGVGPHAVNRDLRILRTAWRWARKRNRAPAPPPFEMLPTDDPTPQPLAPEQVAHLLDHAKEMDGDRRQGRIHAVLAVAAFCGLRNSELRGLRWRDLDLGAGFLVVHQAKNRESRTIPLPAALIAILEDHRRATRPRDRQAFVFTSPTGRQWADYTLSKAAREVWEAAGLGVDRDRVKPLHDLRATSASLQLATGADLEGQGGLPRSADTPIEGEPS